MPLAGEQKQLSSSSTEVTTNGQINEILDFPLFHRDPPKGKFGQTITAGVHLSDLSFPKAERLELKVLNRLQFFMEILPILPQLNDEDRAEICDRLEEGDSEIFEIAIYAEDSDEDVDPSAIVVFIEQKVFIDFVDLDVKDDILELLKSLTEFGTGAARPLTHDDWLIRLDGLDREEN